MRGFVRLVLVFVFLTCVSACTFKLGAEKLNAEGRAAAKKDSNKPVAVSARRADVFVKNWDVV